jgi:hypothetical protein
MGMAQHASRPRSRPSWVASLAARAGDSRYEAVELFESTEFYQRDGAVRAAQEVIHEWTKVHRNVRH